MENKQKQTDHPASGQANGPDVFEFMDYRLFFSARLNHLQSVDKKYSQRWVAKKAGIKSPQLLSMIINGQRHLNREFAGPVAQALKLDTRESDYFRLLVDLSASGSEISRKELLAKISTMVKAREFTSIMPEAAVIFKEWYYPALREIVTLGDFKNNPKWVAKRLNITEEQATEGLQELIKTGFLRDTDGILQRSEPSVRTAHNRLFPMYLSSYHLKILDEAFRGIRLSREKRHYEGLTVSVPKSAVPRIKQEIQKFFREIDALCEGEIERQEIVHLHMTMFPLTDWTSQEPKAK